MQKSNTILILDDESIVTSSLKTLLEVEGFTDVFDFNSPEVALESLHSLKPSVIISDFIMPKMNGLDFLKESKKICPESSMILLTGYADKENAIRAINEVGLYKYIEKPWDNDDLIVNVKNALERSHLIEALEGKISELNEANSKLEKYADSLEHTVAARTKDLLESNLKLDAIINNCADGIIIFSQDGKIESVNPAAENMFGLSLELLRSKNIAELLIFEKDVNAQEIFNEDCEKILRNIELVNFVNGKRVPVEISYAKLDTAQEDISHLLVSVIRDVSAQKEMERLRDDFIATLTHDLRTPLLAAIQTLQFFLDGSLGDISNKQMLILDTMKKSNQDMLGLVNALLEVYKYESGKLNLVKTNFNVNELIVYCCNEVTSLARNKELEIKTNIESTEGVELFADRNELRRVIMNFVGNAINYTQRGGLIEVYTNLQGADIIFSVKDNGVGISKEDVVKLFKRFSQGTSHKRSASTGLGLYLSKQIIEAHGGKIWLESDKGMGSIFSFLLLDSVRVKDKV